MSKIIEGESNSNISSIEFTDEEIEMCDITVGDSHSYYANGIVTHNCNQEARVLALLSQDRRMLDIFINDEDMHTATAVAIFGEDGHDKKYRKIAKAINFALNYGGTAFTIASNLDIPVEEAQAYVDTYNEKFSECIRWKTGEVQKMYDQGGKVFSVFGRPRQFITRLKDANRCGDERVSVKITNAVERRVVNHEIQSCCLQGHVRVLTNKGYIPIKELYELDEQGLLGDMLVHTGTTWSPFVVSHMGKNQKAKLYLKGGMTLDCDVNHKIFCHPYTSRSTNPPAICKGVTDLHTRLQKVCTFIPQQIDFPEVLPETWTSIPNVSNAKVVTIDKDIHEKLWYWIGYWIGDGSWCGHDNEYKDKYKKGISVAFGTHMEHKADEFMRFLENLGINSSKTLQLHPNGGKCLIVRSYCAGFVDYMTDVLGIKIGCHFDTKEVPEILFRSPLSHRLAFIDGLMESDGCLRYGNLHMKNYDLLYQVKQLCEISGYSYRLNSPEKRKCGSTNLSIGGKFKGVGPKGEGIVRQQGMDKRYGARSFDRLEISEELVDTYTLTVLSDEHRYVADGIIHKNCGDVCRYILLKLYKRFFKNRDPHVDFIGCVHDEVNTSIDKDLVEQYVRELQDIMTFDGLHKQFPLEVSVDVGNSYGQCFPFKWTDETRTKLIPDRI